MGDLSFIEQKSTRKFLPKKEDKLEYAKNLTHLYMHDNFINAIGDISVCENLTVLYLQNNEITKIENLNSVTNLRYLFLQNNKIKKIENLQSLDKLRKLYLGQNEISVVEGLEALINLQELHLEKQRLSNGDGLCFDPRSIMSISNHMQVLNISHNNISTIKYLLPLRFLKYLNASHNKLNDIRDICDTIQDWYYLQEAVFIGNPVCKVHRYRENIIGCTDQLTTLDLKSITDMSRSFIKRFEQEKLQKRRSKPIIIADTVNNLPKNYPTSLQKAVSVSILKSSKNSLALSNLSDNIEVNNIYMPWKALPQKEGNKKIPPLLRRKNQKHVGSQKIVTSAITNIKYQ